LKKRIDMRMIHSKQLADKKAIEQASKYYKSPIMSLEEIKKMRGKNDRVRD